MPRRRRRPRQQAFEFRSWGGRRPGAGRKRAPENVGLQPHVARPPFAANVPVHVTMRAMRGVPAMRAQLAAGIVIEEIARASATDFRVLHFSVQDDHVHLIAEGDDGEQLSRGMQRLASRIARRVNMLVGRRGRFWRERYHRRDLATPRQFRNAVVYVTFNFRKHAAPREKAKRAREIDGLSSGLWIEQWIDEAFALRMREYRATLGRAPPVSRPQSWVARIGWWKRHGKLDPRESPRSPA